MNLDEIYIKRCNQLAINGLGNTYPNPLVGSVIVNDNKIIGEGFHIKAGLPHAEINAINTVKNKELLKNSTLYVNLEPCSHWGKTPPCAEKIVQLKIPNVVVGTIDTTDKVAGKGIDFMRKNGVNVTVGICEVISREINKRFFTFHEKKRPFIILKWAESQDGFIDIIHNNSKKKEPIWITGKTEQILVHKWRTQEQAILVGTNTVLNDNPQLTSRFWFGQNPLRLIIDKKLQLLKNFHVSDSSTPTLIFNDLQDIQLNENLSLVKIFDENNYLEEILQYLYNIKIQSVIIEGGAFLIQKCIENNFWDEARVFIGNDYNFAGTKAPKLNKNYTEKYNFNKSKLYIFKNI